MAVWNLAEIKVILERFREDGAPRYIYIALGGSRVKHFFWEDENRVRRLGPKNES